MKSIYKIIGNQIKHYRCAMNMTQAKLAEEADISTQYVSLIESAYRNISLDLLIRISDALNVSAYKLLYEFQSKNNDSTAILIEDLLSDCDLYEKAIILETACAIKESIRKNKGGFENDR